ncbi:heterokaryon incompatibility protein-domain-containing protein [Podospora didyma]|uniref:Heterokaryon incompatibility protein-domain-containing protein n=1 Tax=Podospora didyma TaxID=330526 RepID=A0AAE0U0V5_9PEZI|nr:heterokaryon incompatibility protein-domain-containing protein [Podospora didyma]
MLRNHILRQPQGGQDLVLKIPLANVANMLEPAERKKVMGRNRPGTERRLLMASGSEIHAFEDRSATPGLQPDNHVAISYAWGPPEPTVEIIINKEPVKVGANLESALRRLRTMSYFSSGGKLWFDSLCINQDNDAEKSVQVQMMASFMATTETNQAISYLEHHGRNYRAEFAEALDRSDALMAHTWRHIRDGVLRYTILDIPEEVTREKLGHQDQPREHSLRHVAQIAQLEIMGHKRALPNVPSGLLPIVAPTYFQHGPSLGNAIRRAIALASQSACTKPHDRIYGMLSIPGLPDLGVKVDYSKKLANVFTEFSAACVKHKNLDFISLLDQGGMSATDEHGNP